MQALSPEQSHSTKQVLLPGTGVVAVGAEDDGVWAGVVGCGVDAVPGNPVTGAAPYGASLCSAETV